MVIITAGMIGVGKTTLTGLLADHFGTQAFYEPVGDNPVLPLFYENPKQYGFLLQIFFLNRRFDMIKAALADNNNVLDRSIYEDELFTKENHKDGNISDRELAVYEDLLDHMMAELNQLPKKAPDLMVYADADFETILSRIKKRGRSYEQFEENEGLRQYYHKMWLAYQGWFDQYQVSPKIKLDLQRYDLSEPENQKIVIGQVEDALAKIQ
ncbi:deoxynucleoside kinase [Leuconostocaceae bacterium ESL0723]|nr:deoxynucleoside kinase [Lactobacillaceae bacterium L1_55_11]WEV54984.1 deoxynucleoside kinase [Leuconostocaceae bacterium ESL0723]